MGGNISADVTLDFHGITCPHPIVEAKLILDKMETGKVMKMVSNCPGTRDDVKSWADRTGNDLLNVEEIDDGNFAFYIKKG